MGFERTSMGPSGKPFQEALIRSGARNASNLDRGPHPQMMKGPNMAQTLTQPQTPTQAIWFDRRGRRDAEPHRGSEGSYDDFLMVKEPPGGRPDDFGLQSVFKSRVPDLRFRRQVDARVRALRVRAAEVRRRRVHAARHDVCRAAEGEAAPDRVRCERGDGLEVDQGRQRAGRLHGRHAADDVERHVHHQRHRARDRFADASFAGRLLRS